MLSWTVESIILLSSTGGHDWLCHCCTCTGAGAGNLGWVAIKPRVSGIPYRCTPNLGCAGSKGRTHLTSLLLENWWQHTPHSRGHGNCIPSHLGWYASHCSGCWNPLRTQAPYACISKETEEAVPWSISLATTAAWSHHPLSVVDFPGSQLTVVSPLQVIGSKWRHHANRDQEWCAVPYSSLSITQVKIYLTRYLHSVIILSQILTKVHDYSKFLLSCQMKVKIKQGKSTVY